MTRSLALVALFLGASLVGGGCGADGTQDGGAEQELGGGGSGGDAGTAGVGGAGGANSSAGTAGTSLGVGGSAGMAGAGGAASSCVADRYYPCAAAQGPCDPEAGVQRCSASGQAGVCICAPMCGGEIINTNFDAEACRIAFTSDPEANGPGWADALTVSVSEDEVWAPDEQVHRVEGADQCTDQPGWYQLGPRALGLCPVSCAAVIGGSQYSVVIGCHTVWRVD